MIMNEDIDTYIKNTVKLIDAFVNEPTEYNASVLECQLTSLKLFIGNDKFDELPYFRRHLEKATKFLNKKEEEAEHKKDK